MKKKPTTEDTQYKVIKSAVEIASGIEDIGIKSRKRFMVDCRYVYFHLCRKYIPKFILADCGREVQKDHAMVIHGLKEFDNMFNQPGFEATNVYLNSMDIIEDDFFFKNNISRAVERLETLTNKITVEYELVTP